MKPTTTEIFPLVNEYYNKEGNSCGGNLHIVLDDGNCDNGSIQYCLDRCITNNDQDGINICNLLMQMSKTQRLKVYHNRRYNK